MEIAAELGPRPGHSGTRRVPLSGPRVVVLGAVEVAGRPVTIAEIATDLGLHANTVREHLDALADQGLLLRTRSATGGRGRPAWRYEAAGVAEDPRVREYAELATALAGHIHRTSADPRTDAHAAGRSWGVELVGGDGDATASTAGQARRRVVDLLAELGFDPDTDAECTTVALRSCPLLDAARRFPDVVCAVHLGIAQGALGALGGDPSRTELRAFAEPGACRLTLLTGPDRDTGPDRGAGAVPGLPRTGARG